MRWQTASHRVCALSACAGGLLRTGTTFFASKLLSVEIHALDAAGGRGSCPSYRSTQEASAAISARETKHVFVSVAGAVPMPKSDTSRSSFRSLRDRCRIYCAVTLPVLFGLCVLAMAAVVITTKRIELAAPFAPPIGGIVWLMRWVLVWFSTPSERLFFSRCPDRSALPPRRSEPYRNAKLPKRNEALNSEPATPRQ